LCELSGLRKAMDDGCWRILLKKAAVAVEVIG
jgi:hypothetical protein